MLTAASNGLMVERVSHQTQTSATRKSVFWKVSILLVLCLTGSAFASGSAPYCIYHDSSPPQCFYYTMRVCEDATRALGGRCFPNSVPSQQVIQQQTQIQTYPEPNPQPSRIYGMMQDGSRQFEEGRRRGIEQRFNRLASQAIAAKTQEERNLFIQQAIATDPERGFKLAEFLADRDSQSISQEPHFIYRCVDAATGMISILAKPIAGCTVIEVPPSTP